ncbi:MAG: thermonuclease family protein [Desulfomonilaceae bacterium]
MSWSKGLFGATGVVVLVLGLMGTSWAFSVRYALYGRAKVVQVESSNLLKVKMLDRGSIAPIRLLGVGSPRNRDRIRHLSPEILLYIRKKDLWEISRDYVKSLLSKKVVEVWARKWDRYDDKHRLLAYISIPNRADAPLDLNGEIIKNGLGFVTRDYVHVTFASYRLLEENARKNHLGIWKGLSMSRLSSLKE